ncbi:RNA methyltransferase [Candidatus Woesearchaeota archaeon]|nr:RNA methyltransferase [Candidatus Woesearchaeota archaeon]
MISTILIEPETPGNIGAIARSMKNFDLKNLILINPKCGHLDKEALDRATHAKEILKNAIIKDFPYLKEFDYLIATTSQLGTDYNIPRSPITPEQLAEKLAKINLKELNVGILIGREGIGLKNKEILMSDFVVTIPSSKAYPTLNAAHAATIVFYEIFKKIGKEKVNEHIIPATKIEKEIILKKLDNILDKMEFTTKEKKETQRKIWKRIVGKSFLTRREAFALIGFLKKIEK